MASTESQRPARKILLCASGGFQAYSLPGFVLALLRHVADDVQVVVSRAASKIVSTYALEVASRHAVFTDMNDIAEDIFVPHIELTRDADAVLVYPATVNILGKVANGIADELIAAIVVASEAPVLFVPVTNPTMWEKPAVQRNVERLRADGYIVTAPLPAIEVATREGLAQVDEPFPMPTLLVQLRAALNAPKPRHVRTAP
jgi:phosphopantothenoylcysteine decarboxylase/phosphopantothenate--cysteine ligase